MISSKKRALLASLIGLLALLLIACGDEGDGETAVSSGEEPTKVNVAALNNYPPLIYKEDGELVGFEFDLLNAIGEAENLEIEYKEMQFDGFIPALDGGQVDITTTLVKTEERTKAVDFSDPFYHSGLIVTVASESDINSLEDLKGKTIVATQGATTYEMAQQLAAEYNAKAKPLRETNALYMDVESGNSDALVLNSPTVAYRIASDGDDVKFRTVGDFLTEDIHAFAVKKGNTELLERINSGLEKVMESGEYDELVAKWFGE